MVDGWKEEINAIKMNGWMDGWMDGKGKNRLMEQRTMVGWTDRWVEGIRVEWNIIKHKQMMDG